MSSEAEELNMLYKQMVKYDFKKPYEVCVTYEEIDGEECLKSRSQSKVQADYTTENIASFTFNGPERLQAGENDRINSIYFEKETGMQKMNDTNKRLTDNVFMPVDLNRNATTLNNGENPDSWISELLGSNYKETNSILSSTQNNLLTSSSNTKFHNNKKIEYALRTLSNNILQILNAYYSFANMKRNAAQNIQQAIDYYMRTKEYYIRFSRSILLRLKGIHFDSNEFIKNTTNMAVHEYRIFCSHNDVASIYHEIKMNSNWNTTRSTQVSLPTFEVATQNLSSETNLTWCQNQQLSSDPKRVDLSQRQRFEQQKLLNDPTTCLFKYGSPNYEMRLDVNTTDAMNANVLVNQTPNQNRPILQQELTRSTSRDSGFMSPSVDQFNGCDEGCVPESTFPYITHVTSLNPEAERRRNLPLGNCQVCGLPTAKKCLGCYKNYYCSLKCQNQHWFLHKYVCRSSN